PKANYQHRHVDTPAPGASSRQRTTPGAFHRRLHAILSAPPCQLLLLGGHGRTIPLTDVCWMMSLSAKAPHVQLSWSIANHYGHGSSSSSRASENEVSSP